MNASETTFIFQSLHYPLSLYCFAESNQFYIFTKTLSHMIHPVGSSENSFSRKILTRFYNGGLLELHLEA